jgi:hypothetical protein
LLSVFRSADAIETDDLDYRARRQHSALSGRP